MAKKDKKKKDKQSSGPSDPLESVRSAVERTLKATGEGTAGAQKHARELVDEVAHAANRFREAMGELKVLDELKKEVAGLRQRVAALEGKAATSSAGPRRTATRSTAAKRTAAKPAASRSRSTAAKKPAASRSRSTAAKKPAAKSTGTASRSRSTAAKKPAATRSGPTGSSGASGSSS